MIFFLKTYLIKLCRLLYFTPSQCPTFSISLQLLCEITDKTYNSMFLPLFPLRSLMLRKWWSNAHIPGSIGKVRCNTFPIVFTVHGKYRGCDFFKKRCVCGCIIRQGSASQLVSTMQMSWSPLIPRKRGLLLQMTVYVVWKVHCLGLTRKHTTQVKVKAGWLNRRFV